MDWYKHYIGDYQRDTMRLSMEEDGAYRRLLDEYYSTEEPLPLDHEDCFRAARAMTRSERAAVEKILDRYFYADPNGYHHRRADKEVAKASKQAETNRRIAAERKASKASNDSGDEPKDDSYNEPSNEPHTNARASQTTRLPDYQTPDSRPPDHQTTRSPPDPSDPPGSSSADRAKRAQPTRYPDEFEQLWMLYPKRAGSNPKRRACQAFNARLKGGRTADEMLDGVRRYARFCDLTGKTGTEFVMQAATFLGPDEHFTETWRPGANGKGKSDVISRSNEAIDRWLSRPPDRPEIEGEKTDTGDERS